MNSARDQTLSGAGFPFDQDAERCIRRSSDLPPDFFDRRTDTDNFDSADRRRRTIDGCTLVKNLHERCTGSCRDHDGSAAACDAAGCAYYFCSEQCQTRGTTCEQAGCSETCGPVAQDCRTHDGDLPACNDAGCAFYACSNECHAQGSSCTEGGCTESCDPLPTFTAKSAAPQGGGCPWESWIGTNDWGTSDPSAIAASLCGL
jgi:hypothetical protein